MTYIGQQPATTFDAGIQDRFTGLSSNTVTLTHEIAAEEDILVVWNNIVQDKNTYSVGGTGNKTLTLGGTLVSADVVTVYYLNKVMQSVNPTAGSVNTDQLATNAVTNAKMADDAIGVAELSATGTASSSTFLRGDNSWATPSSGLIHLSTISITSDTADATFLHGTNGVVLNDGTYDNFLIIGNGIQTTNDDTSIKVAFSIDNGSNYNAQTYRATDTIEMTQSGSTGTASQLAESISGATSIGSNVGNNLGNGFAFTMYLFSASSLLVKKHILLEALEEKYDLKYIKRSSFITVAERTEAIDGIKFNCGAGSFSKATFRLYGITNG